ncbi:MAG: hypothetical protein JKY66_09970, partial [Spongiibacteraceae bacterium]|nr:hypothetical protein [Spongiibacteraceae bacterium]
GIQLVGNPGAADPMQGVFTTAGSNFHVEVYARDTQGDLTPNYGKESTPERVSLSHTLLASGGSTRGVLSGSLAWESDAMFAGDYNWSEVGIISLHADVTDNDYLGAGNITTTLSPVGRFTPHHFVVENYSLTPAMESFTYLDQAFTAHYDLRAVAADGNTTKNYQGNYNKLSINDDISYGAVNDPLGVATSLTWRVSSNSAAFHWADGQALLIDVPLTLAKAMSEDGPFSEVAVGLMVRDGDDVVLQSAALDLDTEGPADFDRQQLGSSEDFFYGRVYIPPEYGPEIPAGEASAIPFEIQYWNGTAFVININDSTTHYDFWDELSCTSGTASCSDVTLTTAVAPAVVMNGKSDRSSPVTITRPGEGKTGGLTIQLNVDDWLEYDWENKDLDYQDPSAQIHFGLYRGHDRIIYWREVHH